MIKTSSFRPILAAMALLALCAFPAQAANNLVKEMTLAANHFLAALDADQKEKATFDFGGEERKNWHFIPRERNGLPLKEMTDAQRQMAHALLISGMSYRGYATSVTIMSLEAILAELENAPERRDSGKYFFSIFGKPAEDKSWGWRVEGHHLSLNFTIAHGKAISATPSFYGNNPGRVTKTARKGLVTLGAEQGVARGLVNSLSPQLKKKAIIADKAPKDIHTRADEKVSPLEDRGVGYSELNAKQKKQLIQLIRIYVHRHRPEIAKADMDKIEAAGLDKIKFAWAGPTQRGQGHYYRVQGPTFLLEYDNVQNDANHIHAVYRDFENDFGGDILKKHYARHHTSQ